MLNISCSKCSLPFTVAELMFGKQVRCPHCRSTFLASPAIITAQDNHPSISTKRQLLVVRNRRSNSTPNPMLAWQLTASALHRIFFCLFILATIGALYVASELLVFGLLLHTVIGYTEMAIFGLACIFASWPVAVVTLAALFAARETPRETHAHPYLIASFMCLATWLAFLFAQQFLMLNNLSGPEFLSMQPRIQGFFSGPRPPLLRLLAAGLFLLYLRKLALFFGRDRLARSCLNLIVLFSLIYPVWWIVRGRLWAVVDQLLWTSPRLYMFLGEIYDRLETLVGLAALAWLIILVSHCRKWILAELAAMRCRSAIELGNSPSAPAR